MNPAALLEKYFEHEEALPIALNHGRSVAAKALQVARNMGCEGIDLGFLEEAALLHDIGVCRTYAPKFHCHGSEPYIRHGVIGREILEKEGFPRQALVCERHIGVGLTVADIRSQNLPLPERDMTPQSLEEKIVCFADLFFSKNPKKFGREKSLEDIRKSLSKFGPGKVRIFEGWLREFNYV